MYVFVFRVFTSYSFRVSEYLGTIKFLHFWMPENFAVIYLKF